MIHPELRTLLYDAAGKYLQAAELDRLRVVASSLQARLETYQALRDREITLFQPIADKLLEAFPSENPKLLERALKHWLAVMRYCAMAMLLDNPDFLEHRLLEWLTDIVKTHQMEAIESSLYELLQANLNHELSEPQMALVQPFLEQTRATLLGAEELSEILG
jgi:hypothetical protein